MKRKYQIKRYWPLYAMLLPVIIWYLIFKYAPMYGLIISFKDYNISEGIMGSPWTIPLFKHFKYFFSGPHAKQIICNTFIISIYKIIFGMLPPMILAVFIHQCRQKWFGRLVQTLSYLPHFLSWVIIYGILIAFFSESTGLINRWIKELGSTAIPFMTSPDYFRGVLIASDIWQSMGWGAIIYLSSISSIDPTLYEAAEIDGCSRLHKIIYIILPHLKSVFIMLLILKLGSILDAGFDQIYILATPQVLSVSEIIDTWVFKEGLQKMNYSLATAVGLFKSVIGFTLVMFSNKLAGKWGYELW